MRRAEKVLCFSGIRKVKEKETGSSLILALVPFPIPQMLSKTGTAYANGEWGGGTQIYIEICIKTTEQAV